MGGYGKWQGQTYTACKQRVHHSLYIEEYASIICNRTTQPCHTVTPALPPYCLFIRRTEARHRPSPVARGSGRRCRWESTAEPQGDGGMRADTAAGDGGAPPAWEIYENFPFGWGQCTAEEGAAQPPRDGWGVCAGVSVPLSVLRRCTDGATVSRSGDSVAAVRLRERRWALGLPESRLCCHMVSLRGGSGGSIEWWRHCAGSLTERPTVLQGSLRSLHVCRAVQAWPGYLLRATLFTAVVLFIRLCYLLQGGVFTASVRARFTTRWMPWQLCSWLHTSSVGSAVSMR